MFAIWRRGCVVLGALAIAGTTRAQDAPHQPGDTTRKDSTARLKAVTIVATPIERSEPKTITHVDAAAVQLTPSSTPYELLRQTAGLEVHEQGQGPGFVSDASIRGFSSDHSTDIALWIDGVPINEPMNGHAEGSGDWSLLFPAAVQDIDVIRGPSTALFGNFAMAGIVNVRTLERVRGTSLAATAGSFGRADATLLSGFDHGARGGGVLAARFEREDGFRPNARYNLAQGHARVVHDLKSGWRIDGGAELYGSDWNSPGYLGLGDFAAHDYSIVSNETDGGFKRRAQERVSARLLKGNLLWRTTTYATQGRWQLYLTIPPAGGRFEGTGSQTEEEDSRVGLGATTALTWALSHGELTIGGESRWDRSQYENYFTTSRARDSVAQIVTGRQLLGAPFVQGYWNLADRLRVDLGARYDVLDTRSEPQAASESRATHAVFSPKIGALFRVRNGLSLYGNTSRGFRSSDGVIAEPSLQPIAAWSYESGVKIDRDAASATLALFRMDVSNEQTFNPVTLESTSGGASRRQGVEVEWRAPLREWLTFFGDWTFNDARYRSLTAVPEDGGSPVVLNGLRVYNTSKYVGDAALDFASAHVPLRFRVGGNWVGPYSPFDQPGVVLGAYGLAHASIVWRRSDGDLTLGVRNLFDRPYPELVAGEVVAPGQPRSAYLSVRVAP